ncbi:hypothetical protein VTL71DRAFT_9582 [Oculimacula yallundae]|uniref:Uncharacterized protein n=1 Tax=Oculimacula yallundae TaxID=86028 RepID=A0ABR4BR73_9HELO
MSPHMSISINKYGRRYSRWRRKMSNKMISYLRRHNSSSSTSSDDEDTKRQKKNKRIDKLNKKVTPKMLNAKVFPKVNSKDKYPKDFDFARRVEWFLALDSATLDRINDVYDLPTTGFGDSHESTRVRRFREKWSEHWGHSYYSDAQREHRVLNLFEFLGVDVKGDGDTDDESRSSRSGGRGNRGLGWAG